ncbi:hypothetical protein SKAU_G00363290 [Synaphobranchus kaupii]|uniref:Uncharacterized protein n=1 Tax=Synaphobranchus kaupii TaxID=118154 RepID=A0A9Q1EIU5_SYNKA|nr:hypothetical protein SKAU_G00363290 [Synaphobranchus kaupii]
MAVLERAEFSPRLSSDLCMERYFTGGHPRWCSVSPVRERGHKLCLSEIPEASGKHLFTFRNGVGPECLFKSDPLPSPSTPKKRHNQGL